MPPYQALVALTDEQVIKIADGFTIDALKISGRYSILTFTV